MCIIGPGNKETECFPGCGIRKVVLGCFFEPSAQKRIRMRGSCGALVDDSGLVVLVFLEFDICMFWTWGLVIIVG